MKVPAFVFVFLLWPAICSAQSVMFGKRFVAQDDTVARMREIAGAPDRMDSIAGDASSPPLEFWT